MFMAVMIPLQELRAETTGSSVSTEKADGSCRHPRAAINQMLWWIQEDPSINRVNKQNAAACFYNNNQPQIAQLAYELKTILDIKGIYVDLEAIPNDPDYRNQSGVHHYILTQFTPIELIRVKNKWLITPQTIALIPALYANTIPDFIEKLVQQLPSVFHITIFNSALHLWQIVFAFILIIIAIIAKKFSVLLLNLFFRHNSAMTNVTRIKKIIEPVTHPLGGITMAVTLYLGIPWLQLPIEISRILQPMSYALGIFSLAWFAYQLVNVFSAWLSFRAANTATKLDDQSVPFIRKTLKAVIIVIGGVFILQNLNINVSSLVAGLGIGGLAFALAAKDSIANFFGSAVIFIDKPFQIDDWIIIENVEGIIEEIGFRTTKIRTFYNSVITIPNAKMTTATIDNYGARRYRRYKTTLSLTYDTPPERMLALCEGIRAVLCASPAIRKDYYVVEFVDFGQTGLEILVYTFIESPDWASELRVRTYLNMELIRLAKALDIRFAFPTQTIHVDSITHTPSPPQSYDTSHLQQTINAFGPQGKQSQATFDALRPKYDPAIT